MIFSVDKLPNEPVNRAGGQDDEFLCESNRVVVFPKVGKTQGNEPVNRAGGQDDEFLCESNRVVVFPKVGKTQGNKWKYIVNQGKETEQVQGILVETCRNFDDQCKFSEFLPSGYKTTCKQVYVSRRLLSVSDDEETAEFDNFEFPSACCCSYARV
ncbi:Spaetzle [Popillia japonica]|uniref:Spaetzle n=1 Tax=Popillia japonica TaxID=7064 RepID=A0AAW1LVS1_POPJA